MQEIWHWLQERWTTEDVLLEQDHAPWLLAGIALVVLLATFYKPTWNVVKYSPTVIHEMGHAVMALLTFRKIHGLRVETDESGVLVSSGRKGWSLGSLLTTIAGYPAPAVLATVMTLLMIHDRPGAALTMYHTLLLFALFLSRNVWGIVSSVLAIGLTVGVSIWNDPTAVSWTVAALIIFYSITGIRGSFGLWRVHFGHLREGLSQQQRRDMKENRKGSDAHNAWKQLVIIPPAVWVFFFIGINIVLTGVNIVLLFNPT